MDEGIEPNMGTPKGAKIRVASDTANGTWNIESVGMSERPPERPRPLDRTVTVGVGAALSRARRSSIRRR